MLKRIRKMAPRRFTINLMGDTMLGRLIDQMFPQHVHEPNEAHHVQSIRSSRRIPSIYGPETPWGDTLSILRAANLNILNLETSATTHLTKWPNKVFNYRMHPANIDALVTAKIHYAGLANNHTLDFSEPGLLETVRTVKEAGIAFAGAGEDKDEALRPAILTLPSSDGNTPDYRIHVWAAADHPDDWAIVPTFHHIDYASRTRDRLKQLLSQTGDTGNAPDLKVFSVHWGPNYSWQPAQEIRDLAHFLIDECGIDVIHGHSSHHVQGVEAYHGKLIIYGCGDFVDDYALVPSHRTDLSGIWQVTVVEDEGQQPRLSIQQLEVIPTMIDDFRVRKLHSNEADAQWVCDKIKSLSSELNTAVQIDAERGTVVLRLNPA